MSQPLDRAFALEAVRVTEAAARAKPPRAPLPCLSAVAMSMLQITPLLKPCAPPSIYCRSRER
jgi:hypothetical protein